MKTLVKIYVKSVARLFMIEKPKLCFDIGSITIKANIELSGKETKKYLRDFFTIIIVWMVL